MTILPPDRTQHHLQKCAKGFQLEKVDRIHSKSTESTENLAMSHIARDDWKYLAMSHLYLAMSHRSDISERPITRRVGNE